MPWSPEKKYIWDFWFALKDGKTHLFYLQADRQTGLADPEILKDRSSVGHAILGPFGWRQTMPEPALAASTTDGAWDNLSIWTGSIIKEAGSNRYFMFYTARRKEDASLWTPSEWQRPQNIGAAVSNDLDKWQRLDSCLAKPIIANPGADGVFDGVAFRDPFLTRWQDRYYNFIAARMVPNEKHNIESFDQGGSIVYLDSNNLEDWSAANLKILVASRHFYQMEVPQLFWRTNGSTKILYLIFCAQQKDCSNLRRSQMPETQNQTGTYWMRSKPVPLDYQGIPELVEPAHILAPGLYAGRILEPCANTPVFFGFSLAGAGGISEGSRVVFCKKHQMSVQ